MVGEFLLEVNPRAMFQDQPHVIHRQAGHVRVADHGFVDAERERHRPVFEFERLADGLQMLLNMSTESVLSKIGASSIA